MRGGGPGIAINLHQHEPRRVILLLQDVEAQDAGFLQTVARVESGRLLERHDALRFDMDLNVNYEHVRRIRENPEKHKLPTV
jgi:hypothetical protein